MNSLLDIVWWTTNPLIKFSDFLNSPNSRSKSFDSYVRSPNDKPIFCKSSKDEILITVLHSFASSKPKLQSTVEIRNPQPKGKQHPKCQTGNPKVAPHLESTRLANGHSLSTTKSESGQWNHSRAPPKMPSENAIVVFVPFPKRHRINIKLSQCLSSGDYQAKVHLVSDPRVLGMLFIEGCRCRCCRLLRWSVTQHSWASSVQ